MTYISKENLQQYHNGIKELIGTGGGGSSGDYVQYINLNQEVDLNSEEPQAVRDTSIFEKLIGQESFFPQPTVVYFLVGSGMEQAYVLLQYTDLYSTAEYYGIFKLTNENAIYSVNLNLATYTITVKKHEYVTKTEVEELITGALEESY